MKKNIFSLLLLAVATISWAQEFNTQVRVNVVAGSKLVDPRVYKAMETAIKDLMDTRRWTEDQFKNEERINTNINITVKEEISSTSFKADIAIQGARTVFNSGYESPLITYLDKDVVFDFQENTPLDLNEIAPNNNLSAVCGYYSLIILGLDYDSFSLLGGQQYFQRAQALLNACANTLTGDKGWKPVAGDRQRTRYWVMESLMNPRATNLRKAMYDYYINGLDLMATKPTEAQVNIADAIERVGKVARDLPASMAVQVFIDAKYNEVVQMFTGTAPTLRSKVTAVMLNIDGVNAQRYVPLQR
jgi:Domain of unknown function (DUF4835)